MKIQYLILDKEKFAKSSENCWEACAAVCPSGDPLPAPAATSDDPRAAEPSPIDDHPVTVEPSGEDQTPGAPTESVAGAEGIPGPVGGDDNGGNVGNKRLQRTVKSKKAFDSVVEKKVLEEQRSRVEVKMNNTESLSVSNKDNGTENAQNIRKEYSRSRRQKRKSDDADGGARTTTGAKRQATCCASRKRHCEIVVPVVKLSPDTTSKPPDMVDPSTQSEKRGECGVEVKEADGRVYAADPNSGRVAPIKISLDCTQFISNFTDAIGRSPEPKTYRLQRKDELRVQLSQKPPSVEQTEGIRRSEVPQRKKRKSGSGKKSKNPSKSRRKVDDVSLMPSQDSVVLNSFALASEKSGLRSFGVLPPHGLGLEEEEMYPRSPYSRKRRVPSITVTPSPVVFDTEISTYPYGKAYEERKVSRSPRKRTTTTSGGKLPKVVSISTIPPTFVLTSTMKTENQNLDKVVEGGGKPASLKLYLKMTDDRKKTALQMHDAADDCFMVSSTVADEEEFAAESGSSAEMSPDSATNGRRRADEVAVTKVADQLPRSSSTSAPVVANVGSSPEIVNPGSADPIRISASKESPGPSHGDLFSGTRAAAAVAGTLSSSCGVPKDVGMKRRRLESVISSLKPVASVTVSTGHYQGVLHSARPITPHGTTTTTTAAVSLPAFYPAPAVVRKLGPSSGNPLNSSLLSQLVCREPLNIPKPPSSRGLRQPLRTGIFTPTQLNHAVYGVRANGALRNPSAAAGQRQCRPRALRRPSLGPSAGGELRHHFYGAVRFPNQSLVVPMLPHWQLSYRQAAKPCPTSGTIKILQQPSSEANGYDAPLELTTKRSRDAVV